MRAVERLIGSSKAWVVLACAVGIVAMNVAGRIDGAAALDAIKWIVTAWLGAVAVEDSARRISQGGSGLPPPRS